MPAKQETIQFRTPLSRTQRAEVSRLHRAYDVGPNERRYWEREYRTARKIGANPPAKLPGGRRTTRRSQRKRRKNRG